MQFLRPKLEGLYTLAADADNETVLTYFLDSTQRAALPTVKFIS